MIEYITVEKPHNYMDGTNRTHAADPTSGIPAKYTGAVHFTALCGQKYCQSQGGRKWASVATYEACAKCDKRIEKMAATEAAEMRDFRPTTGPSSRALTGTVHAYGDDWNHTACGLDVDARQHVSTFDHTWSGCVDCLVA